MAINQQERPRTQPMSDDQAVRLIRDFFESQEKLAAEREHAREIGGSMPRFNHYTSAASTVENLKRLLVG